MAEEEGQDRMYPISIASNMRACGTAAMAGVSAPVACPLIHVLSTTMSLPARRALCRMRKVANVRGAVDTHVLHTWDRLRAPVGRLQ